MKVNDAQYIFFSYLFLTVVIPISHKLSADDREYEAVLSCL